MFAKKRFGMGSSALLYEIYTQQYETKNMINNNTYGPYIKTYFRCFYDTFILFKGSKKQTENMT